MTGGVSICETNSPGCQSIDVRGVVEWAAVATEVGPTKVIDEKDDDVFRGRRFRVGDKKEREACDDLPENGFR